MAEKNTPETTTEEAVAAGVAAITAATEEAVAAADDAVARLGALPAPQGAVGAGSVTRLQEWPKPIQRAREAV